MKQALFVTGTDTGVGKTVVSVCLLQALVKKKLNVAALKPIASGCQYDSRGALKNEDALLLQAAVNIEQKYCDINPIALIDPVAPHIAAHTMGLTLSAESIKYLIQQKLSHEVDVTIIEGAGGWALPLNNQECLSQVIADLAMPVVLVVGVRLGALNHAILSCQSIIHSGANLVAWVANCIDPTMMALEANIETLREVIPAPCLGVLPFADYDSGCLNVESLLTLLLE